MRQYPKLPIWMQDIEHGERDERGENGERGGRGRGRGFRGSRGGRGGGGYLDNRQFQNQESGGKPQKPQKMRFLMRKDLVEILFKPKASIELLQYFKQHFPSEGGLKDAINNVDVKRFFDIYKTLIKILEALVEPEDPNYVPFIKEILKSSKFLLLFEQNLTSLKHQAINQMTQHPVLEELQQLMCILQKFQLLSRWDNQLIPYIQIFNLVQFLESRVILDNPLMVHLKKQIGNMKDLIEGEEIERLKKQSEEQQLRRKRDEQTRQAEIDLDIKIDYKTCACQPTKADFESDKPPFGQLIPFKKGQPYASPELFFNNHFYILREAYLRDFRTSIEAIKKSGINNIDPRNISNLYIYLNVLVNYSLIQLHGLEFLISFEPYNIRGGRMRINWSKTSRMMPGSLLLIVFILLIFQQFFYRQTINLTQLYLRQSAKNRKLNFCMKRLEESKQLQGQLKQKGQIIWNNFSY